MAKALGIGYHVAFGQFFILDLLKDSQGLIEGDPFLFGPGV
jgi:hypothetical protein